MARYPLIFTILAVSLTVTTELQAQDNCTYRKNALGNLEYNCDSGEGGTLRKDSLGHWNDDRTGTRYRKDSLGNYRSSDGEKTWRKDSLGNWQDEEGRRCREDSLGKVRCD